MNNCESIRLRLSDRYEAFARLWLPSKPRGAVLYLHGIQSHGGWFVESARRLAEAGLAVLLPDRRGSGRNEIDRGHARSAKILLRDTADALDELHTRTGFDRFHIVAVSWGGKLALAMAQLFPARVASLTLIAPGLFPRVDLALSTKLRVAATILVAPRRPFPIPLDDPDLFTANPARRDFIRRDPLALHQVTAGFLLASRRLDRLAQKSANEPAGPPLHLFLAGRDRIIDSEKTRRFVRRLRRPIREITEYPDAHHSLEFEPDREPFFNDLTDWILGHLCPLCSG